MAKKTTAPIITEISGHAVATITLRRPDIHNAFDDELIERLRRELQCLENDPVIRVVVIAAEGKSFSAGADLNWMRSMAELDYSANQKDAGQLSRLMSTLYQINKPTIAVIQGASYGGAVGLIACCDFAIATERSSFCLSEVKIGLAPAVISPYVVKAIGERQARRYFISGEVIKSDKAEAINLIHECLPAEEIEQYVSHLSEQLLNNGPNAMGVCKALAQKVSNASLDTDSSDNIHHYTRDLIAQVRVSDEGQEGLSAFLEKRQPSWQVDDLKSTSPSNDDLEK